MIKLFRPPKPLELTPRKQSELTKEFKINGTPVWQKKFIVDAVTKISDSKCCFCECKLNEEAKYLEVEHFHHKALYPNEVVEWLNLLPICRRCNGKKHEHDTKKEPIINPCDIDPRRHIFFKNYRLKGKENSSLGQLTIDVVYLNDTLKLGLLRYKLGERICKELEELYDSTEEFFNGIQTSTVRRNKIINKLKVLLNECQPDVEYASTAATVLLNEERYDFIKTMFMATDLWDDELTDLEARAEFCRLDVA